MLRNILDEWKSRKIELLTTLDFFTFSSIENPNFNFVGPMQYFFPFESSGFLSKHVQWAFFRWVSIPLVISVSYGPPYHTTNSWLEKSSQFKKFLKLSGSVKFRHLNFYLFFLHILFEEVLQLSNCVEKKGMEAEPLKRLAAFLNLISSSFLPDKGKSRFLLSPLVAGLCHRRSLAYIEMPLARRLVARSWSSVKSWTQQQLSCNAMQSSTTQNFRME